MAKYNILMSCGHEDLHVIYGTAEEREKRIQFFKEFGLCRECYRKLKREEEIAAGLQFHADISPFPATTGDIRVESHFTGNTQDYASIIHSLGYQLDYPPLEFDSDPPRRKVWFRHYSYEAIDLELARLSEVLPDAILHTELISEENPNFKIAQKRRQEMKTLQSKIMNVKKPAAPEFVKGKVWNQKIYGRTDHYSIYLNGEKVSVSNEEARKLEIYLKDMDGYQKEIEALRATHRQESSTLAEEPALSGFGERIRKARESLGLTQEELASRMGISDSAISSYENEASFPKQELLLKLISALHVDANYLFQDSMHESARNGRATSAEYEHMQMYQRLGKEGRKEVDRLIQELEP